MGPTPCLLFMSPSEGNTASCLIFPFPEFHICASVLMCDEDLRCSHLTGELSEFMERANPCKLQLLESHLSCPFPHDETWMFTCFLLGDGLEILYTLQVCGILRYGRTGIAAGMPRILYPCSVNQQLWILPSMLLTRWLPQFCWDDLGVCLFASYVYVYVEAWNHTGASCHSRKPRFIHSEFTCIYLCLGAWLILKQWTGVESIMSTHCMHSMSSHRLFHALHRKCNNAIWPSYLYGVWHAFSDRWLCNFRGIACEWPHLSYALINRVLINETYPWIDIVLALEQSCLEQTFVDTDQLFRWLPSPVCLQFSKM